MKKLIKPALTLSLILFTSTATLVAQSTGGGVVTTMTSPDDIAEDVDEDNDYGWIGLLGLLGLLGLRKKKEHPGNRFMGSK